ncbi:signal peptidase subunit 3 [Favolaschia claudopus]|uniref:Signal peptidase subunit 3 n=1 Tax=Favolaschia claudopus TaxID=2862362 RepID=A0AAW0D1H4_9AGAR
MHTLFSRINNTSALLSSCVMGLLAAIAMSSLLIQFFESPIEGGSVLVKKVKITHGRGRQYKYEHAHVDFELDAGQSRPNGATSIMDSASAYRILLYTRQTYPPSSTGTQNNFSYTLTRSTQTLAGYAISTPFHLYQITSLTRTQVKNAVVIWDRIVRRKADAKIHYAGKQKYHFKDTNTFRDASAVYTLRYNVMPHVGALVYGVAASTNASVPFPPMVNNA